MNERQTSIKINKAILQGNSFNKLSNLKLPEINSSVERNNTQDHVCVKPSLTKVKEYKPQEGEIKLQSLVLSNSGIFTESNP